MPCMAEVIIIDLSWACTRAGISGLKHARADLLAETKAAAAVGKELIFFFYF